MKTFTKHLDAQVIETAIAAAERLTSGEIRVVLCRREVENAVKVAESEFARLKMHRTRQRNGVLILVAPASKKFAIFGDKGIHERCGQPFWEEVATAMSSLLRVGKFTEAIVHGIQRAGSVLAQHFPHRPDDKNELPDKIVEID